MSSNDLPFDDHIVRYVKPSMINDDGEIDGAEFRLRPSHPDETGLSVHWLEAFGDEPNKIEQVNEVRSLNRLVRKTNGRFAELKIGTVIRKVARAQVTLRIIHSPLDATEQFREDPSHAEIIGLPPSESDQATLVGDLIAQCVVETYPATD